MYRHLSHLRIYGLYLELLFSLKPHPHQHVPSSKPLKDPQWSFVYGRCYKLSGKFYFGLYQSITLRKAQKIVA